MDVSKPLVTNMCIGLQCQPVVYEGVNQLCFTCGHLGHRWEFCQFTIKPNSLASPRDTFVTNIDDRGNQAPTSPVAQPKASPENRDTSEEESKSANFDPWVVVSRKRKESKLGNKKSSNRVADSRAASGHVNSKETLGSRILNNEVGSSSTSKNEGNRKAQFETGLNMLHKEQTNAKESMSMGLGHVGLENQGRFYHGFVKGKPNSNSMKGKKDFARSRALHVNSP